MVVGDGNIYWKFGMQHVGCGTGISAQLSSLLTAKRQIQTRELSVSIAVRKKGEGNNLIAVFNAIGRGRLLQLRAANRP